MNILILISFWLILLWIANSTIKSKSGFVSIIKSKVKFESVGYGVTNGLRQYNVDGFDFTERWLFEALSEMITWGHVPKACCED